MTAAAAEAWGREPSQVAEQRPSLGGTGRLSLLTPPGWACQMPGAHPSQGQCQGPQEAIGAVRLRARPIGAKPTPSGTC